ncbi:hypothetical protein [Streptomyces sp. NPDC050388]
MSMQSRPWPQAALALVAALDGHWDTVPCPPGGKTVRAEPLDTTTRA